MARFRSSRLFRSFRLFMNKEITEELTPKNIERLAYATGMPSTYRTVTSVELLEQLEMQEEFSASNVLPLAKMLKEINRNDLGKKVEKFHKLQKKEQKKKDDFVTDNMCQVTASIQAMSIKLHNSVLEQMEPQTDACSMGHTTVEKYLSGTSAIIEVLKQFQEMLLSKKKEKLVSRNRPQLRQESIDFESLDSSSTSQGSCEDRSRSPVETLEQGSKQAGPISKTRFLPRDFNGRKKPMLPPVVPTAIHAQATEVESPMSPDEHVYDYVTHTRESFSPHQIEFMHYSSAEIVPASVPDEGREQLAIGPKLAPQIKPKPAIARKPTKFTQNIEQRNSMTSSIYTEMGSLDTSTGDSGFVDAKQFRKPDGPPRVLPRHYTPLKPEQRETVGCYATPAPQDGLYDEVSYGDNSPYVNYSAR